MSGGMRAVGEAAVVASLVNSEKNFKKGLNEAAEFAGELLVRTARQGMASAGSPAPPGGYPGNVTGNLSAGIRHNVTPHAMYFKSTARHKSLLEDGTSKMLARPVITTAAKEAAGEVSTILNNMPFKRLET